MNAEESKSTLLQLKIDYLKFMEQILNWFDPNSIGVLFALLMENDYLTQEQLMELTGFSRATISETITKLAETRSKFPVLQTRKPGDKKKYYYCPLDFEQYIRTFITAGLEAVKINVEFIPPLLHRVEALTSDKDPAVLHIKKMLIFYWAVTIYYHAVVEYFEKDLERYFENPEYKPNFSHQLKMIEAKVNEEILLTATDKSPKQNNDSLEDIKRDFTVKIQEVYSSVGRRKDLGTILLALFLEHEPVTQDDLIEITSYSRSTISEILSYLSKLDIVEVVKKPKDRKKYFKPKMNLNDYSFSRIQMMKRAVAQIKLMMESKFLPDLEKSKAKREEKEKLEHFFKENIRSYQLIENYTTMLFDTVQELLKKSGISYP